MKTNVNVIRGTARDKIGLVADIIEFQDRPRSLPHILAFQANWAADGLTWVWEGYTAPAIKTSWGMTWDSSNYVGTV